MGETSKGRAVTGVRLGTVVLVGFDVLVASSGRGVKVKDGGIAVASITRAIGTVGVRSGST